ncbi:cytosine-5--methyltransferase [Epithele typhae]|uniref:cytosine-5--methyltransferase n=1 Tax=Epithele typhae TaxID=378194 RepID=UPI002008A195|nr:cytosine-5--methyltransferase [Epithele typhae]KAH9929026.1 cytosine-5--methyltransferase [Epithele typhae]
MRNERLEKYYKAQAILPEDEYDAMFETMRNPLPTTFRVAGSRQAAKLLNETIKDVHVPHLAGIAFEGEAVSPPQQLPWYPDGLAWQFNVAKKVVRKSPEFKKFHSFLVFETEVGNISRQEAVSMLPPLFLEVEPHHRVIDMCAAPGSKTAQLLEALHANDTATSSSLPSGLLIANDSDYKRTHLLIHQSARLPSPSLMVTNLDASIFPAIKIPSEQTTFAEGTKKRVQSKRQYQLMFDRILCDVPCSGDGTMRKNPGIWKHWSPMDGNGLHSLQLRILQRAMRMLKKGGRLVYSTCSLNPVENEAVVAAALKSIPGFELVDMSGHLPGLVFRPGLTSWRPTTSREISMDFATFAEYDASLDDKARAASKMLESHWPPSPEEARTLSLERCFRIYPHLQDTGGFFIAVLQKTPPARRAQSTATEGPAKEHSDAKRTADAVEGLDREEIKKPKLDSGNAQEPTEDAEEELLEEAMDDPDATPTAEMEVDAPEGEAAAAVMDKGKEKDQKIRFKKGKTAEGAGAHFKENPYTFIAPNDPIVQACIDNFDLAPSFPAGNMLVRNPAGDTVRSLYMVNAVVKSVIEHNDFARIRLMTAGTKVFGKQEGTEAKRAAAADTHFRVLAEGLPVVLPFVGQKAQMTADFAAMKVMMESYYPLTTGFAEPFRSAVEAKGNGSYVVRFQPGRLESGATLAHELVLPIWKSNVSVTLMLDKRAKSALSLRVFGEDITAAARQAAGKKKEGDAEVQGEATPEDPEASTEPMALGDEDAVGEDDDNVDVPAEAEEGATRSE